VQNTVSGWEIVNVVEKRELSRDSSCIGWIALGLGFLMLLVCAFLSMLISRAISRPLDMLEETIKEVGNGNYRVDAEFGESEIGKIGSQFKNMVNNNLELHERLMNLELKEKEAELLLLQSQINPHFLYNTLDALYFKALIDKADDVAEMVQALSETFKLSLNKGDKLITVRDEIAKIQAYMKVQNMRHDNRFQFLVELEEEMLPCKMLAFILQPLVENAVYHGLEPKVGNGYVRIEGYMESGDMVFHIIDNGVGIDDMQKLDQGYGVRNVRERIRLFYGEEYILSYDSRISEGTTATVILPILKEEQECTE
jgi:two-component system sensor histidine kinase YesM